MQKIYLGMQWTQRLQSVNQLWNLGEDGASLLRVLVEVCNPPGRVGVHLLLRLTGCLSDLVQLLLHHGQPSYNKAYQLRYMYFQQSWEK